MVVNRFRQLIRAAREDRLTTHKLSDSTDEPEVTRLHESHLARLELERLAHGVRGRPRIMATACWHFPIWSQTFVYQELSQLMANGFALRFLYWEQNPEEYIPSQFSKLWRARRPLLPRWTVWQRDYAHYSERMSDKINALVDMLCRASGMTEQELRSNNHFFEAFSFTRMVEAYSPAYLHSYFFYEGTLFTFVASYLLNIPRGVSCYADHMLKDYALKVIPLHLKQCSLVVATSHRIKQELLGLAPDADPDRILVKPNAVDMRHFSPVSPREPEQSQPYRLVCVSRIEPKKGLQYLVEAVRILRDREILVEAHLLGGVDDNPNSKEYARSLHAQIDDLKLQEVVHLEGRKTHDEIKQYFAKAHLFTAPFVETDYGDKDGIPTALLEAMAAGLPVVATDAGSILEVVGNGRDGIVVRQRDPMALANAIETLLRNPIRRHQLSKEAVRTVGRNFDVRVCERLFHERIRLVMKESTRTSTITALINLHDESVRSEPAPQEHKDTASTPLIAEGRLERIQYPPRPEGLENLQLADLCSELLARIQNGDFGTTEAAIVSGHQIQTALQRALDVHNNRVSRKRYQDLFSSFTFHTRAVQPRIAQATVVDLGCGSINPFGFLFLFLMLGAQRGVAIDLDPIQDMTDAVKALADCAAMMLLDPSQIVGGYPITRDEILKHIASFDLGKLNAGDPSGMDTNRLSYRREPLNRLPFPNAEADIVMSNAVLEHISQVEEVIAEMARVTRKGGVGIHTIDGSDHRRYSNPACHPLELLTVADGSDLVHGSNRIRPAEFGSLFQKHGFEVLLFTPFETVRIDAPMRKRFVEPFRSMSSESLAVTIGNLVVRRL